MEKQPLPVVAPELQQQDQPVNIVVGSGLAGLLAAIKLREQYADESVLVLEKRQPQTNSQIAGQRYRAGITHQRHDGASEIASLLAQRNDGVLTPQMKQFATTASTELMKWQETPGFLTYTDSTEWFGPQFGSANRAGAGRGKDTLRWFSEYARQQGVMFADAEVNDLLVNDGQMEGLVVSTREGSFVVQAARYILANGGVAGYLYESTNRSISKSGPELGFFAGLSIRDNTVHMIHPFGNANSRGDSKIGCFETDKLAGAQVYIGSGERLEHDAWTTSLLASHEAHYHFPDIARRFFERGAVVTLKLGAEDEKYARVSHHYGHAGIVTTDGVSVLGAKDLYAVGDASGLGYWTNGKERFPGFALTKCLVDAAVLSEQVSASNRPFSLAPHLHGIERVKGSDGTEDSKNLRRINTHHVLRWLMSDSASRKREIAEEWQQAIPESVDAKDDHLAQLSRATARIHREVAAGAVDVMRKEGGDIVDMSRAA